MEQEQSGLLPKDYKERPREAKKTKDSTFERIWKYYHNSKTRIELEDWEDDIRIRWEAAWFMLCGSKNQKEVADFMEAKFLISKSVAYDDVRHAMRLFGDPRQDARAAKRAIAETITLRMMDKTENSGAWDLHERYLQKYMDLNGLKDKGADAKLEDLIKKLKPQQIILVSSPEELEAKANALQDELTKEMEYAQAQKHEGESTEG
jgi:phosphoribosylpyrophosphate synthetase